MPTGLVGMLDGLRASGRYGVSAATANNTVAATVARWGWGNATQGTNVWGVSRGVACALLCDLRLHLLFHFSRDAAVGLSAGCAGSGGMCLQHRCLTRKLDSAAPPPPPTCAGPSRLVCRRSEGHAAVPGAEELIHGGGLQLGARHLRVHAREWGRAACRGSTRGGIFIWGRTSRRLSGPVARGCRGVLCAVPIVIGNGLGD